MATSDYGLQITRVAGGAITQFTFVKLTTAGTVVACSVDGELPVGIAMLNGGAGDAIPVRYIGSCKVLLGETIEAGRTVGTMNNGRAGDKQFSATGSDTGDWAVGLALQGGVNGDIIEVLLGVSFRAP